MQRKIGLTGGIATGKTTVANDLAARYQLPILDADLYAREAVAKGSAILNQLCDRYGSDILLADGTLNRKALGAIIFHQPNERLWVEEQIHPYVRDRFQFAAQEHPPDSTLVLVIPLLFEAKMIDLVTEIWVVSCSLEKQLERLIERDRFSFSEAKARIDSQMPLAEKAAQADIILDNSGNLEALQQQIDQAIASR